MWLGLGVGGGAAGSIYYPVEFTNVTGHTCHLFGFPGVSAIYNGHQAGSPAGWGTSPFFPKRTVTLAPGATAHTVLRIANVTRFPQVADDEVITCLERAAAPQAPAPAGTAPAGSTGAAAALWAAAGPGAGIAAVVSRGGRPDLARPRLAAVTVPTLLIVGGRDEVVLDLNRRATGRSM